MASPDQGKYLDKQPTGSMELLTIDAAAKLLGVSSSGLRRLQQERRIPFFKVGRCVRIAKSDIAAYLAKRRIEPIG